MTKLKGRRKKLKARQVVAREQLGRQLRSEYPLRVLQTLMTRRELLSKGRRDCGNEEGRPCANCKAPVIAILLDECVRKLIEREKISVGPKQPYTHPQMFGVPLVEYSRCPFFVANEALFFAVLTNPKLRSYLQHVHRQVCRKIAKEMKRAINAVRDQIEPHLNELLVLNQITTTTIFRKDDPVWIVNGLIDKIAAELPKLVAEGKALTGPRGDPPRRSIYIAMLKVWKELTGHLPARNNTTFHDFAHAALLSIHPNATDNYSCEAATKTALKALK
jgi:hypothetical protein